MAVIVSSSVQQNGTVLTGDIKKIIVVRTNPGYGPAPGKPGTGQVVAIICDTSIQSASLQNLLLNPERSFNLLAWLPWLSSDKSMALPHRRPIGIPGTSLWFWVEVGSIIDVTIGWMGFAAWALWTRIPFVFEEFQETQWRFGMGSVSVTLTEVERCWLVPFIPWLPEAVATGRVRS
jgi:hypothetical protein